MVEVYREDLREFAGNISEDSHLAMEEVKHSDIVEKARAAASGSSFLHQIVEAIASTDDDDSRGASGGGQDVRASRLDSKLSELQRDIGTYCTSPPDDKAYTDFCSTFAAAKKEKEILDALASSAVLAANYHKFVPVVVSYEEFWKRYFFREMRLREREKERQDLILRASEVALNQQQIDMSWDDDTEWKGHVMDEMNFSSATDAEAMNYSAGTVLTMIEGAVTTPTASPQVKEEDLLLDGWEEGPVLAVTATTADMSSLSDRTTSPEYVSPTKKVSVTIIEDYAGWE